MTDKTPEITEIHESGRDEEILAPNSNHHPAVHPTSAFQLSADEEI